MGNKYKVLVFDPAREKSSFNICGDSGDPWEYSDLEVAVKAGHEEAIKNSMCFKIYHWDGNSWWRFV